MTLPDMNFVEWVLFTGLMLFMLGGAILVASFFWSLFTWLCGFISAIIEHLWWQNMLRKGRRCQRNYNRRNP